MDLRNFCIQNAVWQSNLKYQYKMKKISILFLLILVCSTFASAQKIQGKVYFLTTTGEKEAGAFANVWWAEGKNAVETDENGEFTLKQIKGDNITLIAAYVGYAPDTVKVFENGVNLLPDKEIIFNLSPANELESVYVTGRQEANFLSKTANIKTEVISAAGLCKMACCSLAESFESSASVSVGYSDAVTGAKQIKLLGLSGSYTQMLDETRPVMRGLASPFGLSYIPGQWLESIQIAKGSSSVINVLEAGSGSVALEKGTLILGNDSTKTISSIGTLHVGSGSVIHLNSMATLQGFAKAEGSSVVTIGGSGVFDIGDARNMFTYSETATNNQIVNNNQSYFKLADDWTGTVLLSGAKNGSNDKHLGLNLHNLSNQ